MNINIGSRYRWYDTNFVEIVATNQYRCDDDSNCVQYELLFENGFHQWVDENFLMVLFLNGHLKQEFQDESEYRISI